MSEIMDELRRAFGSVMQQGGGVFGIQVIQSEYATMPEDVEVRRTWRERWLTQLHCTCGVGRWEPWRATRTVTVQKPAMYRINNGPLLVHPSLMGQLRELVHGSAGQRVAPNFTSGDE